MPFETKDIGGGLQSLQFEGAKPTQGGQLEQAQQYLGLVDLGNRIRLAPTEQAIKESELAIKQNQQAQMQTENNIRDAQLYNAQQNEIRQQKEFFNKQLTSVHDLFAQSFDAGNAALQEWLGPTAKAFKNPDGTITAKIGNRGFTLDPQNTIKDPVQRQQVTRNYNQDWVNSTQDFKIKSQAYRNLKGTIGLATGAGDVAGLYNFIKMIEPGIAGAVREGELILGKATTTLGQQWINDYNRAVKNPNAPMFGDKDSVQRKNFISTVDGIYQTLRADVTQNAQSLKYIAERNHLDPKQIITPVGGETYETLLNQGAEETQDVATGDKKPGSVQPTTEKGTGKAPKAKATEAGFAPSKKEPEKPRYQKLDDLMPNLFVLPEGR